jgi:hypothetical protein
VDWNSLVDELGRKGFAFAIRMLGNADDAAEAVQESLVRFGEIAISILRFVAYATQVPRKPMTAPKTAPVPLMPAPFFIALKSGYNADGADAKDD